MDKLDKNISIYAFEGLTERRGQDTYNIFEVDIEGINIKAFGLYNGHGSKGKECSKYVSDAIEKLISENKNELKNLGSKGDSKEQITKIFVDGFKKIQNGMKDLENCPFELSGSTATIALIINNKVCYIINIGDNIAIIGRKSNTKNEPIQLNKIHDVTENKDELERIKNNGGEVRCNNTSIRCSNNSTFMRIYFKGDPFYPGLTISRSLGDLYSHDLISDEPEVSVHTLEKEDGFIFLGTFPFWQYMSSQEVVDFIYKKINENSELKNSIAEEVVKECRKNWCKINKKKDIKIFEEIKNDPKLDNDAKNEKIRRFINLIENFASLDPEHKKIVDIPPMDKINPDEIFHGNHNILDITCIIYFFGNN